MGVIYLFLVPNSLFLIILLSLPLVSLFCMRCVNCDVVLHGPSTVAAGGRVNGPPASPVRDYPRHRLPKEPAGEDEMSWPRFHAASVHLRCGNTLSESLDSLASPA